MDFENSLKEFNKYHIFLKIISKMMQSKKNIIFDTGIFKHYNCYSETICDCCDSAMFDEKKDFITIRCDKNNPILFDDIMNLFKKIQNKIQYLNKKRCYKPIYHFEKLYFDHESDLYKIEWNIEPNFHGRKV